MRIALVPLLVLFSVGALALAACNDEPTTPRDEPTVAAVAPGHEQLTVTHILIGTKGRAGQPPRSKAKAREIAESVLRDALAGRPLDEMVNALTDDRDSTTHKPNTNNGKPGSYTWPTQGIPAMTPAFESAARALPVGKVSPVLVETQYGFHIVRRDSLIPPTS